MCLFKSFLILFIFCGSLLACDGDEISQVARQEESVVKLEQAYKTLEVILDRKKALNATDQFKVKVTLVTSEIPKGKKGEMGEILRALKTKFEELASSSEDTFYQVTEGQDFFAFGFEANQPFLVLLLETLSLNNLDSLCDFTVSLPDESLRFTTQ